MRDLPVELLFFLAFAAIAVFNVLMQRAARRKQAEGEAAEPEPDEFDEEQPHAPPAGAAWPATSTQPARAATPSHWTAAYGTGAPAQSRRRFDRQRLLGDRRALHDAFVVATLLGPCRAQEPHDLR